MLQGRVGVAALVLVVGFVGSARAQDAATVSKVDQINKRAMGEYDMLEFDNAKKMLNEALSLLKKHGLDNEAVAAKTYGNLGIVYVAGLKDRYKGFQQFVKALQLKPDFKLDPAVATPELQEVFDNARETVGVPRSGKTVATTERKSPPASEERRTPVEDDGVSADVKGIVHNPIDSAPAGQPISVPAQVGSNLQATRVFLFYRPPHREDFATVPMTRTRKGTYVGTIPGEAVSGHAVQYYIEARDARGRPLQNAGSPTSPNIITVTAAIAAPPADTEDNPLEKKETSKGESTQVTKKPETGVLSRHNAWITLGVGTGGGWTTGNAELATMGGVSTAPSVPIASGVAPAYFHVAPELGFFLAERWALSLQGRIEAFISANPQQPDRGSPAVGAFAAFGRVMYFFSRESFRGYFDFAAGGGDLRHVVDVSQGNGKPGATDTVNSGPIFLGPGLGFHWDFSDIVGVVGEVQSLIGADQFTAHVDFNLGLAINL